MVLTRFTADIATHVSYGRVDSRPPAWSIRRRTPEHAAAFLSRRSVSIQNDVAPSRLTSGFALPEQGVDVDR